MQTIHLAALSPHRPVSRPIRRLAVPTVKSGEYAGSFTAVPWPAIPRAQERVATCWRMVLASTAAVCTGIFLVGVARWQTGDARTAYIPFPSKPVALSAVTLSIPASYRPLAVTDNATDEMPTFPVRLATAPAMLSNWTLSPAFTAPTPVDYAARDRQIADLKVTLGRP